MNIILSILVEGHTEARELIYEQEAQVPIHRRVWNKMPDTLTNSVEKVFTPDKSIRSSGPRREQPRTPVSLGPNRSSSGKNLSRRKQRRENRKSGRSESNSRQDVIEDVAALKEQLDRMDTMLRKLLESSGGHADP